MAKLILRKGQYNERRLDIKKQVVIGRASNNRETIDDSSISIPDSQMSRQHSRMYEEQSRFFVEDLGSTNGTFINNRKITARQACQLKHRDTIVMGKTQLIFFNPAELNVGQQFNSKPTDKNRPDGHSDVDIKIITNVLDELNVSRAFDAKEMLASIQRQDKSEQDYQEVIHRLQAMTQVSIALGTETQREKLPQIIIDSLFSIFPSIERAFIALTDRTGGDLIPLIASSRKGMLPTNEISISNSILQQVINDRKSLLLLDAMNDKRFQENVSVVDLSLRSVMCCPLIYKDDVLGIIQVDTYSEPRLFKDADLQLLTGISAQVAISVKNTQLHENIEQLFEGFVTASVQAIEDRDPVTAGHSFRVADYTCKLAEAVNLADISGLRGISFSREQMREIRYASLLHDFGKVGVKEQVLQKAKKLYPYELDSIKQRFEYANACLQLQMYKKFLALHEGGNLTASELNQEKQKFEYYLKIEQDRLESFYQDIVRLNEPAIGYESVPKKLREMSGFTFTNHQSIDQKLLSEFEFSALELSHGSLTPEERIDIETHVSHTFAFLNHIPWTESLAGIPSIAHAHHEKLDGTGYPQRLQGDEIPIQSQIMAIADIYDALTAVDRPYKKSLAPDKALDLLQAEVRLGKLNEQLFKVFVESGSYLIN